MHQRDVREGPGTCERATLATVASGAFCFSSFPASLVLHWISWSGLDAIRSLWISTRSRLSGRNVPCRYRGILADAFRQLRSSFYGHAHSLPPWSPAHTQTLSLSLLV
jgi:hypothetical protein